MAGFATKFYPDWRTSKPKCGPVRSARGRICVIGEREEAPKQPPGHDLSLAWRSLRVNGPNLHTSHRGAKKVHRFCVLRGGGGVGLGCIWEQGWEPERTEPASRELLDSHQTQGGILG